MNNEYKLIYDLNENLLKFIPQLEVCESQFGVIDLNKSKIVNEVTTCVEKANA